MRPSPKGAILGTTARSRYPRVTTQTRHAARSGGIVAATWIIGLGVVFLVQQVLDLSWGEAWPLFVILVGAGSLVGVLVGVQRHRSWFAALAWPVGLLVAGVLLLLSTTDNLGVGPAELIGRWWPVAVIAWGVWLLVAALLPARQLGSNSLELPMEGATSADVKVSFGGGSLTVGAGRAGLLLSGTFEGFPAKYRLRGPGSVHVEPEAGEAWPWANPTPSWSIGLPTDVPVDLQVDSGANRTLLDLGDVAVRSLRINTGASETIVRLPRAAAETRVRADSGAASITFEVPPGVAARVRGRMALGSTQVDEARFPRADGGWESPDYGSAANRVEIEIQGGVGSVRVR
jgi:hypothetical protein